MSPRILVVDDSLTVRMDLTEALQEAGCDPVPCSTLAEARAAVASETPALVLLDVHLPDGDGVEFLGELKCRAETRDVPVLLLSSEAEVGDRVRGLTMGADDFLGKPYDRDYVARRAAALLETAHGPGVRRPAPLVLTIDDCAATRDRLRRSLEDQGYAVRSASSGEDGLRLAARLHPDAIVVDGVLPGVDGHEVLRRLRADPALRRTPCVLLTGSEEKQDELLALDAGADAYARKDESIEVILARLAALLRGAGDAEAEPVPLPPPRVLAVDGDAEFLESLAASLQAEGREAIRARSGEEAGRMLAVQSVDCVVVELRLPDGSGLDLCRLWKADPQQREIPVVVVSADPAPDALAHCLAAGADDFVPKLVDRDVLLARLNSQIRRRRVEEENRRIRRMTHAVRKSETTLRAIFEYAPDGVVVLDRAGRIVRVNERAEEMFGYSRAELVGQPLDVLVPDRHRVDYQTLREEFLRRPERRSLGARDELWARRRDGSEFPIEATLGAFTTDGETLVLATVRDVTERRREQSALRAKEDEVREVSRQLWLAGRLATMGELAASVAHELNNPLTTLALRLESLLDAFPADHPKTRVIRVMEQEIDRMAKLVANLLQFTRADSNQLAAANVRTQVEETLEMIGYHLKKHRVTVALDLPRDLPAVHADRMKLKQVFLNLLVNASDAMPRGGELRVRGAAARTPDDRPAVAIEFVDTGEGIAPENLSRVMEPFFTTKPEGRGTGLGLPICRRIVQEHGGVLELTSEWGRGATARVVLPAAGDRPPLAGNE